MVSLTTIKSWFATNLRPTQAQFWATWDSFVHKDDTIPIEKITGIAALFTAVNNIKTPTLAEVLLNNQSQVAVDNIVIGSVGFALIDIGLELKTILNNGQITVINYSTVTTIDEFGLIISNKRNKVCQLDPEVGLSLKTKTDGFAAILRSSLITGSEKVFELPNISGTLLVAPEHVFDKNSDALADGLQINQIYRTSNGQLMIVYPQ